MLLHTALKAYAEAVYFELHGVHATITLKRTPASSVEPFEYDLTPLTAPLAKPRNAQRCLLLAGCMVGLVDMYADPRDIKAEDLVEEFTHSYLDVFERNSESIDDLMRVRIRAISGDGLDDDAAFCAK